MKLFGRKTKGAIMGVAMAASAVLGAGTQSDSTAAVAPADTITGAGAQFKNPETQEALRAVFALEKLDFPEQKKEIKRDWYLAEIDGAKRQVRAINLKTPNGEQIYRTDFPVPVIVGPANYDEYNQSLGIKGSEYPDAKLGRSYQHSAYIYVVKNGDGWTKIDNKSVELTLQERADEEERFAKAREIRDSYLKKPAAPKPAPAAVATPTAPKATTPKQVVVTAPAKVYPSYTPTGITIPVEVERHISYDKDSTQTVVIGDKSAKLDTFTSPAGKTSAQYSAPVGSYDFQINTTNPKSNPTLHAAIEEEAYWANLARDTREKQQQHIADSLIAAEKLNAANAAKPFPWGKVGILGGATLIAGGTISRLGRKHRGIGSKSR